MPSSAYKPVMQTAVMLSAVMLSVVAPSGMIDSLTTSYVTLAI